jgi:hypothetical protein
MKARCLVVACLAACGLRAQDVDSFRCANLRGLTSYEFSVISAVVAPRSGEIPEYCRVRGQILPEVQFEVDLPAQWNGRFLMTGNGGYAGEDLDSSGRNAQRSRILNRGFALAATNTGHDAATEPLGAFAANPQKLIDYAFRAVHVTAETAKRIIGANYGRAPQRSYFEGCSTGGRQGLISAQRFPQDFDGIVVGAPVLNFTGTMVSYAWMARAFARSPIPISKLKLISDRIYARCDARDGLQDGLIDDPRQCDFSPRRDLPVCEGAGATNGCLTPGEVETLETIYGDVMSNGQRFFPGWPVGAEVAAPDARGQLSSGWLPWFVRENGPPISVMFGESFFRNMAFRERDPQYDFRKFDFDKDPARLDFIHRMLDATDADLSPFKARSGKIVMYYGWADPALNPIMGVEYYENVLKRMGSSTPEFFRLFMVPGMFHCMGGVGTDRFDALTALTEWVEQGRPPDQIRAARVVGGKEVRARPLCPYPQTAIYKGSGSIDDAANFSCGIRAETRPTRSAR